MGNHRATIFAFRHGIRIFESLVWITSYLFPGSFSSGTNFRQKFLTNNVRQNFIFHLDGTNSIVGNFFPNGTYHSHFLPGPLQFRTRFGNHSDSGYAFHCLGCGNIYALHFGMGMGAV